jgi:acetolactate synthase-1/2/3 large subunit
VRRTAASLIVEALEDEGIPFTFGIPGTHNIELYDALAEADGVVPFLVTDEQSASFMADGLWRASGKLGCVNVVPGAGLTHALSGIAEAYLDNVPMLVLGCGIRRDSGRSFQLHDVDQLALVRPVVKTAFLAESVKEAYGMVREACSVARAGVPGPVFVEVPANLYMVSGEVEAGYRESGGFTGTEVGAPDPERVASAVDLLRNARRPLLYLGAGAAGAGPKLVELAERLESPVSTTFQGKGVFPESHPLFLWPGFGDAAPAFARKVASMCDATLAIGCRFSEVGTGSYGIEPPDPLIHVDLDPGVFDRNYPAQIAIQADAAAFVEALLAGLGEAGEAASDAKLRNLIQTGHEGVWEGWLKDVGGPRVTPAHLLNSLQDRLGPEAVYTTDSGNGTFLAMEGLRLNGPRCFLAPVDFSCMGYSVPAAIGAKLGQPDAPVVALAGDGAFLMTGLEVLSAARDGVGVMVLVLRDRELAQIAQFQDTALSRKVASEVADYDLGSLAKGLGVDFLKMASDDDVQEVVDQAADVASAGRPVLVDVNIDYTQKTYFTRGVVKTNLLRLPFRDQARFVGRALKRKLMG